MKIANKFICLLVLTYLFGTVNVRAGEFPKIHGFAENASGFRLRHETKTNKSVYNLMEQRFQLKARYYPDELGLLQDWNTEISGKIDILMDEYTEKPSADVRELYVYFSPFDFMDLKVGRHVITWGTGDYLFVNDLFPKDYVSFLTGRDDEYLKRPSYAARATFFTDYASLDLAVIPFFTPNNIAMGDRLSFYDPLRGAIVGKESDRYLLEPPKQPENTEIASRIYGTIESYEWAGYFFKGFYKNPMGYKNESNAVLYYPELYVYGGSFRGPVPGIGGIANAEMGYYYSNEDNAGKRRTIPNSSVKYIFGYKRAFKHDLEIGVQYFLDNMLFYGNYKDSLSAMDSQTDELYQQFTLRITKLFWHQTLRTSLFTFYSPTDGDIYFRPSLMWDATDSWNLTVGGNVFVGEQSNASFGQYRGNNNIYMRLRYSF